MKPHVEAFYDPATFTISYVLRDPMSPACAIVDPVLDYDPDAARTDTVSARRIAEYVVQEGLRVEWILETHAHADHLSAAAWLRAQLGGRIGIGARIREVQQRFGALFALSPQALSDDGFDRLFEEGARFQLGELSVQVWHTPGHTPACVSYLAGDTVFVGDTLFMPDYGTARADFPGGDAHALYRSMRRLLSLPESTRMFLCHDYPPGGRAPCWETTVGAQRRDNLWIHDGVSEAQFVRRRAERDRALAVPRLILPSLQVNIRGGQLPPADDNGVQYLRLPLNQLGG